MKADIANYYPSITEEIVRNASNYFREKGVEMSQQDENIILKSKVQMASAIDKVWVKKNGDFDNSMGSLDGCELCEYVGLFLLSKMKEDKELSSTNVALYRDDLILETVSNAFQVHKIKLRITKIFEDEGLKMCDWEEGLEMNYLDVAFDISQNTYKPFQKENTSIKYISPNSDHPPTIIKQIPKIVGDRISMLCSNEDIHKNERTRYEELLKRDGYGKVRLDYKKQETEEERIERINRKEKNRSKARFVSWFNPPFSWQVETGKSVGKAFFNALDACFPKGHPLHKILNRNTVKLSYRTMPNFGMLIKGHNNHILKQHIKKEHEVQEIKRQNDKKPSRGRPKTIIKKDCNCNRNTLCPLQGKSRRRRCRGIASHAPI